MEDPFGRPAMSPALFYADPARALEWLAKAFGFERVMVITDDSGAIVHSEMRYNGGLIYVGAEWADFVARPEAVGGRCTQIVHVRLAGTADAHCERARAAGAEIMMEPADQFYGDRVYRARDHEGHVWTFVEPKVFVSREDAEAASGLKIEGWL